MIQIIILIVILIPINVNFTNIIIIGISFYYGDSGEYYPSIIKKLTSKLIIFNCT